MSLIACPECNKDISDKAACCINCGYPIAEEAQQQKAPLETSDYFDSTKKISNNKHTGKQAWYLTKWVWVWVILFWPVGVTGLILRLKKNQRIKAVGFIFLIAMITILATEGHTPNTKSTPYISVHHRGCMQSCHRYCFWASPIKYEIVYF
ncbi:hypothetical protein [Bacterioplanoides sp.]|uniref:hypothetical protein n=1 Tax=Bacterioplanoides sp. TaxID=2066072 RepID=UPI003B00105A